MSKFTSGPWKVECIRGNKKDLVYARISAGARHVGFAGVYAERNRITEAEALANANLIAAAPLLLTTLKLAHEKLMERDLLVEGEWGVTRDADEMERDKAWCPEVYACREAIAKAEGRAS